MDDCRAAFPSAFTGPESLTVHMEGNTLPKALTHHRMMMNGAVRTIATERPGCILLGSFLDAAVSILRVHHTDGA